MGFDEARVETAGKAQRSAWALREADCSTPRTGGSTWPRPAGPRRSPPSLTLKTESSRTEKVASRCFDTSHANGTFSLKDIKKKPFGVHPNVHFPMSPTGLHARINSYFTLFGCNEREILERTARWRDSLSSASLVGAAQRCSDSDACSTLRAVKSARAALASYVIRIRTGQVSASRFVLCFRLASRSLSLRPLERRAKAG